MCMSKIVGELCDTLKSTRHFPYKDFQSLDKKKVEDAMG
jgi:hypothetical protein